MEHIGKELKMYDSKYASKIAADAGYCAGYVREVLKGDRRNEIILNSAKVQLKKYERKYKKLFKNDKK